MRKAIMAAVATLLGASAACAADIEDPSAKVAAEAMPFNARWTGFYAGGQAGITIGKAEDRDLSLPIPVPGLVETVEVRSTTINGPAYGGYFGYNWQAGPLVYGVEASFSGADLGGAWNGVDIPVLAAVGFSEIDVTHDVSWFASATGRLGYAQGRMLFYGLAGFVWGNEETTLTSSFFGLAPETDRESARRVGWTAGLGIEYALSERFSTRIEYSHVDFGDKHYLGDVDDKVDIGFDTIKLGASYKLSDDRAMAPLR